MYNSAKSIVSRRAPAKSWYHDDKAYEEKSEEEKKKNPSNFQTSTTLTPVGNVAKGFLQNWVDYTDHVQDNFNEILENGDGNLLKGLIATTAKDMASLGINKIESQLDSQDGTSAKPVIYSDWSPASKLFGMNQDTAFSEHMANTAHQREVADLKAAGLNPVLGISGSGASSVSGNAAVGSSSAEKVDSFPWLDVLGATAGLVTTVVSKNPTLGYMVANVFNAFDK